MKPHIALKLLACMLATGYAALIIYVSLVPFEGWDFSDVSYSSPFWKRPLDPYWTLSDIIFNILAYVPLSILCFFSLPTSSVWLRSILALWLASSLSFGMESLQAALPARVASWLDWLTNSVGAAIGLWCVHATRRSAWLLPIIARVYSRLFHLSPVYVAGQAVLGLWSLAHLNPALPPFGLIYQRPVPSVDVIRVWIECIQLAFECVGIGLFFSLLLQPGKWVPLGVTVFLLTTIGMKYLGASALFHADAVVMHPHQWLGIGIGTGWLAILLWLPLSLRRIASGVAMVSSIGVPFLGKDLLRTDIPFDLFNWSYGQLTHFNQLTYATVWAATIWIVAHLALLGEHPHPPSSPPKPSQG